MNWLETVLKLSMEDYVIVMVLPLVGTIRVREFGWGSPCTEYHFDDYDLHEYSIVKAVHYDEWYLKKNGYQEVCSLRYLGGKNWETM